MFACEGAYPTSPVADQGRGAISAESGPIAECLDIFGEHPHETDGYVWQW